MSLMSDAVWPVLTRYDREHLRRIALPLGGIGTGTVSLGGRGDLRDWEIVNRPAKGFAPRHTFFALFARTADGRAVARALEAQIDPEDYSGPFGCEMPNSGLPRFRTCAFQAAYPFGQVLLADPDVPLEVRLDAFNPLIPADADASGLPVAILRYVLTNRTATPVHAAICGSVQNFIGDDGTNGAPCQNTNTFRAEEGPARVQGLFMRSEGVAPVAEQWGTLALATTAASGITHRTAWATLRWGDALLDFWDDFSGDGRLESRDAVDEPFGRHTAGEASADAPVGSLAVSLDLAPGESSAVTFLLAWHFPNRQTWTPAGHVSGSAHGGHDGPRDGRPDRIGNYYATRYRDAWHVATSVAARLPQLEADTLLFVRSFCESDLPHVVKEAALYNLSTLRTQTCFRTDDGRFYGWEGCGDRRGSCHGSCTHVWNYEQATAFLFGDLARSMRDVEFQHALDEQGRMSFRTALPLGRRSDGIAAADGQMGCVMKLYRDWQLSGDDELLRALWPSARKALEFCWIPGGWDADRDGVMEGCQHTTYDVEFYGPNPLTGLWYLGALRAAEEMAGHVGETAFAATCRDLYERGRRWIDTHLFNGAYYEQEVHAPRDDASIAPGLRLGAGAMNLAEPELQLGAGCLVDQLAGQYLAHVCGLGYLVEPEHVRATLQSIWRHNYRADLSGHFNHMRTFALDGEAALVICAYPRGRRPARPLPYFNEVMTGFEYTAAVHMLYEGQVEEGLACIGAIRARYDGRKRNPFNEAECGHHYARAMASWAAVLALTGFRYSRVHRTIQFAATNRPAPIFWSAGYAWGTCRQQSAPDGTMVTVTVLYGQLEIERLVLDGVGTVVLDRTMLLDRNSSETFLVPDPERRAPRSAMK